MRSDSLYVGSSNIRVSQLISIVLMTVCLLLLIVFLVKYTKNPKPIEGVDFFPPKTEKELEAERKKEEKKAMKQKMKGVVIRDGKIVSKPSKAKEAEENAETEKNDSDDVEKTEPEKKMPEEENNGSEEDE